MTKKPPLAIILFVIVVCFVLGIVNVVLTSPEEPAALPTSLPTEAPQDADTSLQSVLILGVDRLDVEHPILRSVWFALFQRSSDTVYLHGVPLNASAQDLDPGTLQELFTWNRESGTNQIFNNVLYRILPLSPNLTVILDDQAFSMAIDYLGGIDFQGAMLDGDSALSFVSLSTDDYELLLNNQAQIIKAMIPEALKLAPSPELTDLVKLIPEHASLSLDVTDAIGVLSPLRTISEENIFFILLP
jgi:hypothetical protein